METSVARARRWLAAQLAPPSGTRIGAGYVLRVVGAALASVLLCRALRIEHPVWAIVSSVVVIQPELRASVSTAAVRVVANLVGAGIGIGVGAFGLPPLAALAVGLVAVAALSRLLHIDAAVRSACVALVIVLHTGAGLLGSSETRVLLVLLGCATALAITVVAAAIDRLTTQIRGAPAR